MRMAGVVQFGGVFDQQVLCGLPALLQGALAVRRSVQVALSLQMGVFLYFCQLPGVGFSRLTFW